MNRSHSQNYYTTQPEEDGKEGYCALALFRQTDGVTKRVARVIYWDACGQFFIETFDTDIPLAIAEELIAEALRAIEIR